jgi:Right handed beta helix region
VGGERLRHSVLPLVAALLASAVPTVGSAAAAAPERRPTPATLPRIVYAEANSSESRRLHGSMVGARVSIGLSRPNAVRSVTFFVDQPVTSKRAFATDRVAPFAVPRAARGAMSPYAVGHHTLRAQVELRTGRTIGLQVTYTIARILEIGAHVDGATLQRTLDGIAPGPVLVRPTAAQTSFSISGSLEIGRPFLTIERAELSGTIEFKPTASGSSLRSSTALGFFIFGADDILLEGNVFDGRGVRKDTIIWDEPAGNAPDGWVVRNNVFRNYYTSNPDDHTQAMYVGYSTNGLIEGNTFTNNGNTSHIFFTWFGNQADHATTYPRNICVRGNTFNDTVGAFYDVNFRSEIPVSANIKVQRNASSDSQFYGDC